VGSQRNYNVSIPDELRNIRDHLRSGSFGQREVWEQQLEKAADENERLRERIDALVTERDAERKIYNDAIATRMTVYEAEIRRMNIAMGVQADEIARLQGLYDSATDQAVRYADDNERLTRERDEVSLLAVNRLIEIDRLTALAQSNDDITWELTIKIERLQAAYDSRGGEMDSMRMVLAETQKWNEDRIAEIERLQSALLGVQESTDLDDAHGIARHALEQKP
jgi:chromosome segregation ATPase